jgi:dTDP-4-amino-4,6-dideoxygalactose transaminase
MALMAYDVGPGDAIFTTPFTFIATAETISLLGATPVFIDIDPNTFNIEPNHLDLAITALRTGSLDYPLPAVPSIQLTPKGIIAVDLFGLPADYDRINAIADKNNLWVIEDAAQSFGSSYKNRPTCSLANIACTSFFPAKPLGCYGDGGMCFTDDDTLAEAMQSIRVHGKGGHKYDNARVGINGRLDTIQAAILDAKFDIFPREIKHRNQIALRYSNLIKTQQVHSIHTPRIPDGYFSAWAQYSLLAKDEKHRASLQAELKNADIPTAIYYPKPLHLQTAFHSLGYKIGDFPVSEDCAQRIFSLPMHPYLTELEQQKIVKVIRTCD